MAAIIFPLNITSTKQQGTIQLRRKRHSKKTKYSRSFRPVPTCRFTPADNTFHLPIFNCIWANPPETTYSLGNVTNSSDQSVTQSSNATILWNWLRTVLEMLNNTTLVNELKGVCAKEDDLARMQTDDIFYTLDQKQIPLLNRILQPLCGSVDIKPDVGILYKCCIVGHCEVQSSPMENTVAKLTMNITDELRFVRHYLPDTPKWVGFAFPNTKDKGYVCTVTSEFKNLVYSTTAVAYAIADLQKFIEEMRKAIETQMSTAEKVMDTMLKIEEGEGRSVLSCAVFNDRCRSPYQVCKVLIEVTTALQQGRLTKPDSYAGRISLLSHVYRQQQILFQVFS